jgi:hypothetical protein
VVHARHSQNQVRGLFRCEWSSSGLDLPACLFGAHPAQQEYVNSMLILTMVKHIHVFLNKMKKVKKKTNFTSSKFAMPKDYVRGTRKFAFLSRN